jgi:uncharacterized membrane protein (DUF373 family)
MAAAGGIQIGAWAMSESLPTKTAQSSSSTESYIAGLVKIIRFATRAMAALMVFVIIMGVADIVYVLYEKIMAPPVGLLEITDILATFGAFMAVLIAIEIFVNITVYLREDVIHVHIVLATALMAIARKVIVLDLKELTPSHLYGLAAIMLATGVVYWLVVGGRVQKGGQALPPEGNVAVPVPDQAKSDKAQ